MLHLRLGTGRIYPRRAGVGGPGLGVREPVALPSRPDARGDDGSGRPVGHRARRGTSDARGVADDVPPAVVVSTPTPTRAPWILETADRILTTSGEADCRVAFLVAGASRRRPQFLGPLGRPSSRFTDPDRAVIRGLGPRATAGVRAHPPGPAVVGAAEGWHPAEWRRGRREPRPHHELEPPAHPRRPATPAPSTARPPRADLTQPRRPW